MNDKRTNVLLYPEAWAKRNKISILKLSYIIKPRQNFFVSWHMKILDLGTTIATRNHVSRVYIAEVMKEFVKLFCFTPLSPI